jgi:hypothetical protein
VDARQAGRWTTLPFSSPALRNCSAASPLLGFSPLGPRRWRLPALLGATWGQSSRLALGRGACCSEHGDRRRDAAAAAPGRRAAWAPWPGRPASPRSRLAYVSGFFDSSFSFAVDSVVGEVRGVSVQHRVYCANSRCATVN